MTNAALALFDKSENQMPAYLSENAADADLGNENLSQEDMAIPRLNLLQKLSPQVDDIPGARAGQFHNSVTDELYDEVYVMNLGFKKEHGVFKKRALGGGFHGSFDSTEAARAHIETLPGTPTDYEVVETAKHLCLMLDENGQPQQPILLMMKSSGLNVSRRWNSEIKIKGNGAARFATVWKVSSKTQSNDRGVWANFVIGFAGWATEELYNEAKALYESVKTEL